MRVFPFYTTIFHLLFIDAPAYNSLEGFTAHDFTELRVSERIVYKNNKVRSTRFVEDVRQSVTIGVNCPLHA